MCPFPLGAIIFQKPFPGVAGIASLWWKVSLSSIDYTCIFSETVYCDWQVLTWGFTCAMSGSKPSAQLDIA